jgi:hypothetical protein
MGVMRNSSKNISVNQKGGDSFGDLGVDGRII